MPLPVSGAISFNNINVELGVAGTTQASLGQASYRTLAGVPSGQISMSNFYGKANQFAFTISSNQTNANLRTLALNAGWNGTSKVVATINSGVYCSSNSTGTPGLTVNGSFPGGVELINNGFIVGMGGNGGRGWGRDANGNFTASAVGGAGGTALSVSTAISVRNNNTIAGGGGGGGGGGGAIESGEYGGVRPGSGGGGGRSSAAANSSGALGGRADLNFTPQSAFSGSAGTVNAAGAAGAATGIEGNNPNSAVIGGGGGNGGGWGAAGGNGTRLKSGSPQDDGKSGGAGGAATSGGSNITWLATGTRLGALS